MKKRFIACGLILLILLGLSGCKGELPAVYVQSVSQIMGYGAMGEFNICAGVVVAQDEVKIERDESRKIAELKVEVGQTVTADEVLFVYDTEEIDLSIDKIKLEIEQMKNTVKDLDAQIKELEKEKKIASEADQLYYTVRIQSLETDRKETNYNITMRQHDLEVLRDAASNDKVTAPIDGTVKAIHEDGGYDEYTGQPLPYITLAQDGAYRVKGNVNELNRDEFYVGQSVIVRSRVDASATWTGILAQIDNSPEDSGNGMIYYGYVDEMTTSSTYPFYIDLDSTEGLLLGQHVYIEPNYGQTEEQQTLRLYADYILGSAAEGYYVWAADSNGKIEKREIKVGTFDELLNSYEVTRGLNAEDRIAFPSDEIRVGAPVTDTMPMPDDTFVPENEFQPEDENAFAGEEVLLPEEDFLPDIGVDDAIVPENDLVVGETPQGGQ